VVVDKKKKPILRASPQLKKLVRRQLAAEQVKAEVEPSNDIPFRRKSDLSSIVMKGAGG
jgi:hypothetical protein